MRSYATHVQCSSIVAFLTLGLLVSTVPLAGAQETMRLTQIAGLDLSLGNFMEVTGGKAYVTTIRGLDIIDISNPDRPDRIGRAQLGSAFEIAVAGDYAYIQTGNIKIVNISRPGDLTVAGAYGSSGYSTLVERDGLLFAVKVREGMEVLDIGDPEAPVKIGQYLDEGYHARMDLKGDIVYLADMRDGVEILDISDPSSPRRIGILPGTGAPDPRVSEIELHGILSGLMVHEDLLIVGLRGEQGCLRIYDISDPASPQMIGELSGFMKPCKLTASGGTLICCDGDDVIAVVDTSDPHAPRLLGRKAGGGHDLHFDGQYLYAALQRFRVYRLQLPPEQE